MNESAQHHPQTVDEFQQALQNFTAGGFAGREAKPLFCFMEVVAEFEVIPAVGGGNRLIHLDVQITELLNVGGSLVGVVEAVVGLGQTFIVIAQHCSSMNFDSLCNVTGLCISVPEHGKRPETLFHVVS